MVPTLPNLDGLIGLAKKDGVDIRPTLLRVLTDLYVQRPGHNREEEQRYTELALSLLPGIDIPSRVTIAKKLARYPAAPRKVVQRLCRDAFEVAEPVLMHSPCLTAQDLLYVLKECDSRYAGAIAARVELQRRGVTTASDVAERRAEPQPILTDPDEAAAQDEQELRVTDFATDEAGPRPTGAAPLAGEMVAPRTTQAASVVVEKATAAPATRIVPRPSSFAASAAPSIAASAGAPSVAAPKTAMPARPADPPMRSELTMDAVAAAAKPAAAAQPSAAARPAASATSAAPASPALPSKAPTVATQAAKPGPRLDPWKSAAAARSAAPAKPTLRKEPAPDHVARTQVSARNAELANDAAVNLVKSVLSAAPPREPVATAATPAFRNESTEAFFRASSAERRKLLRALENQGPFWPTGLSSMAIGDGVQRLEAAAFQRKADVLAREIETALRIPAETAQRIVADESGEPFVVAAKVLAIPASSFARIVLFLNPAIGQSVECVFGLVKLFDQVSAAAALRIVFSWRDAAGSEKRAPRYQSVHWDDDARHARVRTDAARGDAQAVQERGRARIADAG